jgi:hypothetical protein
VITNNEITLLSLKFEILWLRAKDGMRKDPAPATDFCPSVDDHMSADARPFTDAHILPNDRVGANAHTITNLG